MNIEANMTTAIGKPLTLQESFCKASKETFKDFAVGAVYLAAALPFAANPLTSGMLVAGLIASVASKVFMRTMYHSGPFKELKQEKGLVGRFAHFLDAGASTISFAIYDIITRHVLFHEMGHYTATALFYENGKNMTITLHPGGGFARFPKELGAPTALSKLLGSVGPRPWITAAGPAVGIILGSLMIGTAHLTKKRCPKLCAYLNTIGATSILTEISYCVSGFFKLTRNDNSDFIKLAKYGISPWMSLGMMIAIPVITKIGAWAISSAAESFANAWYTAENNAATLV